MKDKGTVESLHFTAVDGPSRATSKTAEKEEFLEFPGRVAHSQDTSEIKVKARCSSSKMT
jgi:hypothetical protein